ncbi:MAG TPA: PLP-dependent aminotransferase family protein [Nocardioides sp.]|uniref:MocR-like pyridoxine biosynthesis transcription factor PdxR n=1 Tax=Nocardioides sp. TaxID=35761 RepID=UPI002E319338|nr:PLP-dependent aminotransferase family protein [Nocardioides sp.]HEX5088300.1 PLP-dependent aminotransferase family protein [Nocardioides sp.]
MAVEWSGSGPELMVALDRDRPLRAQVEDQLRAAIRNGRLAADEKLPSTRSLAATLGLSRGLVQECYEQLVAEGYLTARTGSATRVAAMSTNRERQEPAAPPAARVSAPPPLVADFPSGVPDLAMAPREDWAWAVREACRTAPNVAFDYDDPRGVLRTREVVAAYLRRVRAMDVAASQVVVCSGFAQGLAVVLRALARVGLTRVACEDPGSIGTVTAAAEAAGGSAVPVPVDEHGIDVAALRASGARVAVLTPAHQWPTGVVLGPERRHDLLAWAREVDGVVVEDDYDAEFRYDRDPVGSLQGLDPDRVVTLGTVSKSLAPALRLGWAVVPAAIVEEVVGEKQVADRGSSGIDQLALAALVASGRYDRHLRKMRTEYSRRRDVLVDALTTYAPAVRVSGLAAGFHAVAHLPGHANEADVLEQALARGVGLRGMSTYRSTGSATPPQLVLGFGNTSTRAIEAGIRTVADLLQ